MKLDDLRERDRRGEAIQGELVLIVYLIYIYNLKF